MWCGKVSLMQITFLETILMVPHYHHPHQENNILNHVLYTSCKLWARFALALHSPILVWKLNPLEVRMVGPWKLVQGFDWWLCRIRNEWSVMAVNRFWSFYCRRAKNWWWAAIKIKDKMQTVDMPGHWGSLASLQLSFPSGHNDFMVATYGIELCLCLYVYRRHLFLHGLLSIRQRRFSI